MTRTLLGITMLSLCITAQAQAQSTQKRIAPNSKTAIQQIRAQHVHDALLNQLVGNGQRVAASKTTSTVTDERLIAQSSYGFFDTSTITPSPAVWIATDSATYHYSGQRGSYYNYNSLTYVNYYQLYNSIFLGQGHIIGMRDKDNKPEILSDSSRFYSLISSDTLEYYETAHSTYDAADNFTKYVEDYPAFAYSSTLINTFGANGITSSLSIDNASTTMDTMEYRALDYTGSHISADSTESKVTGSWDHQGSFTYTYDASGKATRISQWIYDNGLAIPWYENARYDLEYYPGDQFKKMTVSMSSSSTPLTINEVDSFSWTTGVPYYTGIISTYYNSTGFPVSAYAQVKHVSATNQLPDSVYSFQYDLVVVDTFFNTLNVYSYDTYNKPTDDVAYTNHVGGTAYDSVTSHQRYYYQTYTRDATGVNTVAEHTTNISIYPNPANSQLYIAQSNATAGNDIAAVKIFNITGQLVISNACTKVGGRAQVAIDQLPQGTYMVVLQSANGAMLHTEKIVKL